MLYYTIVQSHFQLSISSRCFSNKTLIHKLQTTTNKIIRLVITSKHERDITKVLKQCNVLTIEQTAVTNSQTTTICAQVPGRNSKAFASSSNTMTK